MNSSLRITWVMFGLSLLFVVSSLFMLIVMYVLSLSALPGIMSSFSNSISTSQDISVIKQACLMLANLKESDRLAQIQFFSLGNWLLVTFGIVSSTLSARLLYLSHRSECASLPDQSLETESLLHTIFKRAIRGTLKLWQAYWFLYLPIPIALAAGVGAVKVALMDPNFLKGSFFFQFVIYPLLWSLVYLSFLFLSVVVWRCAHNTNHRIWFYSARAIVVFGIAGPLVRLLEYLVSIWPKG